VARTGVVVSVDLAAASPLFGALVGKSVTVSENSDHPPRLGLARRLVSRRAVGSFGATANLKKIRAGASRPLFFRPRITRITLIKRFFRELPPAVAGVLMDTSC